MIGYSSRCMLMWAVFLAQTRSVRFTHPSNSTRVEVASVGSQAFQHNVPIGRVIPKDDNSSAMFSPKEVANLGYQAQKRNVSELSMNPQNSNSTSMSSSNGVNTLPTPSTWNSFLSRQPKPDTNPVVDEFIRYLREDDDIFDLTIDAFLEQVKDFQKRADKVEAEWAGTFLEKGVAHSKELHEAVHMIETHMGSLRQRGLDISKLTDSDEWGKKEDYENRNGKHLLVDLLMMVDEATKLWKLTGSFSAILVNVENFDQSSARASDLSFATILHDIFLEYQRAAPDFGEDEIEFLARSLCVHHPAFNGVDSCDKAAKDAVAVGEGYILDMYASALVDEAPRAAKHLSASAVFCNSMMDRRLHGAPLQHGTKYVTIAGGGPTGLLSAIQIRCKLGLQANVVVLEKRRSYTRDRYVMAWSLGVRLFLQDIGFHHLSVVPGSPNRPLSLRADKYLKEVDSWQIWIYMLEKGLAQIFTMMAGVHAIKYGHEVLYYCKNSLQRERNLPSQQQGLKAAAFVVVTAFRDIDKPRDESWSEETEWFPISHDVDDWDSEKSSAYTLACSKSKLQAQLVNPTEWRLIPTDLIISADGAKSRMRRFLRVRYEHWNQMPVGTITIDNEPNTVSELASCNVLFSQVFQDSLVGSLKLRPRVMQPAVSGIGWLALFFTVPATLGSAWKCPEISDDYRERFERRWAYVIYQENNYYRRQVDLPETQRCIVEILFYDSDLYGNHLGDGDRKMNQLWIEFTTADPDRKAEIKAELLRIVWEQSRPHAYDGIGGVFPHLRLDQLRVAQFFRVDHRSVHPTQIGVLADEHGNLADPGGDINLSDGEFLPALWVGDAATSPLFQIGHGMNMGYISTIHASDFAVHFCTVPRGVSQESSGEAMMEALQRLVVVPAIHRIPHQMAWHLFTNLLMGYYGLANGVELMWKKGYNGVAGAHTYATKYRDATGKNHTVKINAPSYVYFEGDTGEPANRQPVERWGNFHKMKFAPDYEVTA